MAIWYANIAVELLGIFKGPKICTALLSVAVIVLSPERIEISETLLSSILMDSPTV